MHYVDEGGGPPIVFVHGTPTWSFLCRHLIRGLAGKYRCIAPDVFARELVGSSDWYEGLWRQRDRIANNPALIIWGLRDTAFRQDALGPARALPERPRRDLPERRPSGPRGEAR